MNFPNNLRTLEDEEDHSMFECPVGALIQFVQTSKMLSDQQMAKALHLSSAAYAEHKSATRLPSRQLVSDLKKILSGV